MLLSKNDSQLLMVSTSSITMQSLGRSNYTCTCIHAVHVGAKMWCLLQVTMATCRYYSVRQWPKISIIRWIEKMIGTSYNCHDVLYHRAKFGDQTTRAGCRWENMVFFVCHAWSTCAWGT